MPLISVRTILAAFVLVALAPVATAATQDEEVAVRAADAAFWKAYNACDLPAAGKLLSADVEFYHDKTGLTRTRDGLLESLRKGPCADPNMRLRREAIDTSLAFHPLSRGFALLSGQHRFYVQRAGAPESLDGQASFTTLWIADGGQWRMHRVLSYAHGPAPYTPPARALTVPAATLARYAGQYRSARIGSIVVVADGDHLRLTAGSFVATLYPESTTRFFAMERDLRFDFEADAAGAIVALAAYEHGEVSDRAVREP
ncbi:DUF4440 domain-containing protein [Xanthomonas campestris]|uniref:nuclear transport factor 2 family protein n=1 Tax=Xanthomonas campestris TaxID=339 RepID=UPI001E4ADC4B|nr:DUF4440 domain-containing protein [Xanthomonas campestris]MCC8687148.1 DUF4440 domain-containing protein [Xanthomonas campestris]MCW2000689.1 hypothetical protein [Xanthomonas campestris]MEA9679821.1 DUF4440 domain-containing protein [Xanthomonas campestris pv. raphani]MEA9699588.1 DUF4440 domain-containing protein [Xanthomonas campestris pv. raphani]MEA9707717.1 DUF4440 domain-containing protein [Xanthomonas campestris pv. raphani]